MSLDKDDLTFLWQIGNLASKMIDYDPIINIIDNLEKEALVNEGSDWLRGYITALSNVEKEYNKSLFENN